MLGETVMTLDPGDKDMTVNTGHTHLIESIKQLKEQHPDKVRIVLEYRDGSVMARVPFEWVKIAAG